MRNLLYISVLLLFNEMLHIMEIVKVVFLSSTWLYQFMHRILFCFMWRRDYFLFPIGLFFSVGLDVICVRYSVQYNLGNRISVGFTLPQSSCWRFAQKFVPCYNKFNKKSGRKCGQNKFSFIKLWIVKENKYAMISTICANWKCVLYPILYIIGTGKCNNH